MATKAPCVVTKDELNLQARILVVGDIMLDRYIETEVRRISPEAPVPVASVLGRFSCLGGAANVARNLACLGLAVTLVGVRGKDENGAELQSLLEDSGIMAPAVICQDRPTTCKCRVLSNGQQLLRLDEEEVKPMPQDVRTKLWQQIFHSLSWSEAVIISDYGKGVLLDSGDEEGLAAKIVAQAQEHGQVVCVDPRGTDWSCYAKADCLTPNTRELSLVLKEDATNFAGLCRGAFALMEALELKRILLTRGPQGMALLEKGGEVTELPTEAREVADVSGAGDTVIAVLTACVAAGFDWITSAKIANLGAGIVVGKVGTSPIRLGELQSALGSVNNPLNLVLHDLSSRIVSPERLWELVDYWKRKGLRLVFTNGCFDLIHPGHVQLLKEAASLGDKLIVGLNSDASVKRLKGPKRPLQNEQARALVMAGFAGVDCVVLFNEDTPLELIRRIKPDVLVKGGDYKLAEVVGADFVKAYGGEVHLVKLLDGFSTTGLVSKARPS
ncbi:MAG: D-glycero-beta-D-manno-heptose 1-phosphate adenylyltransferase [Desulfovibrio sp.]|nr:D-glycero-beta-D-manno-heptose 1-phosphate adenylyltransferase [Desulfovibrio sp.]